MREKVMEDMRDKVISWDQIIRVKVLVGLVVFMSISKK